MFTLPSLHSWLDRDFISTYWRTIKASENWDLYVVLNCGKVGQGSVGPWGRHLVASGYSENNYLVKSEEKTGLGSLSWHV